MPISHASIIHKPLDYTTPVDLNLLGKVLQYKQGEYDAGVNKEQGLLDSAASLDVVRDEDRQYLNTKLSNLVQTVNSIGGADYSDPNVSNQIAGLSSQIFGDKNIIDSVSKTKQFRYVQDYYKTLKEKKPKDYNPANEWYDNKKFNSWLSGEGVNPNMESGAGKVTPATAYEGDWEKLFSKMTANAKTEITDKGLMYRIDTQKYNSPEQIWSAASKLLTPAQRQQLAIEGRYTYENLPMSELTKAYNEDIYNKVGAANDQLSDYKTKKLGATAITDQEKYDKLISEKQTEINGLLAPVRKNADQIKEKLYLNEKLQGLAERYSYNQSTTKLQSATDKMFKSNYDYRAQNDELNRQVTLAKEGLMYYVDPLTGQRTIIANPNAPKKGAKKDKEGAVSYDGLPGMDNAGSSQDVQFTQDALDSRKVDLIKSNDKLRLDFVQDLGRKKGLTDVIINNLADDGHLQGVVDPAMEKAAKDIMDAWDATTRGEKINFQQIDPLFKNFGNEYQKNLSEIASIDKYYNTIDKQIKEKFGINGDLDALTQQKEELRQQLASVTQEYMEKGFTQGSQYQQKGSDRQADAQRLEGRKNELVSKISGIEANPLFPRMDNYLNNRTKERNSLIGASDIRYNLPTATLNDDKDKNIAKMISGNSTSLQIYDINGSGGEKKELDPDKIEVISKGYSMVDTGSGKAKEPVITFRYKTGNDKFTMYKVPITAQQANILGFGDVQDLTGYRLGLHFNGEVNDIKTTSGDNYNLKYDIVKKNVRDQNDPSVFIRVKKGNNPIIIFHDNPFPSYEYAIQFMESATKQKTIDEAFQLLDEKSVK